MLVERVPYLDEYIEDGRSVVMFADGRVLALAPVVTRILSLIGTETRSIEALAAELVQTDGTNAPAGNSPDLEAIVQFVIAENVLREAVT